MASQRDRTYDDRLTQSWPPAAADLQTPKTPGLAAMGQMGTYDLSAAEVDMMVRGGP